MANWVHAFGEDVYTQYGAHAHMFADDLQTNATHSNNTIHGILPEGLRDTPMMAAMGSHDRMAQVFQRQIEHARATGDAGMSIGLDQINTHESATQIMTA